MNREYKLFQPNIDPGHGKTGEDLDQMLSSWRECKNDGADEIAGIVDLLRNEGLLSDIAYRLVDGGAIQSLSQEYLKFLGESVNPTPEYLHRLVSKMGLTNLPCNIGCFASATGAIFAALRAAGVDDGQVITTSLNYIGVPNAIAMAGAKPIFVDIDSRNWSMSMESLENALTKKTKAVVLTHLNEFVDIEPIYDLFKRKKFDIPLIQDASLAVGSTKDGVLPGIINVGKFGTTVVSLATSKTITGLGGAIAISNDLAQLQRMTAIAYHGVDPKNNNEILALGFNIKMNDMNAIIAREQIWKREEIFARRVEMKEQYDMLLKPLVDTGKIKLQGVDGETIVTHYAVTLPDRDRLASRLLNKYGIQIGTWHIHHLQKLYREKFGKTKADMSVTESLADAFAFLPFHVNLTEEDIKFICEKIIFEIENAG